MNTSEFHAGAGLPHHRMAPARPFRSRSVADVAAAIADRASARPRSGPAMLAAISGIDGSGKSYLSSEIARATESLGPRVALIGIDPWQHPQSIRFGGPEPGRHFYHNVIRFPQLFRELVDPLVANRSIRLHTRGIRTDADVWDKLTYDFADIDVVLLEGILLFQRGFVGRYDFRIWIECSFGTAVLRALKRNVEARSRDQLIQDYANVYHAAQHYHFCVDAPRARVDFILENDG